MKKKIFSLILAVVLVASMMTVAMVSVSASIDENGRYVPSTEDTYRYYFYMPNSWKNSYTQDTIAGIYWFGGTDACSAVDGSNPDAPAWPGYVAQYEGDYEYGSVYYVDCPDDVSAILWNNYVNGGTFDKETGEYQFSKEQFISAIQTDDISQLDDPDVSCNWDLYPDGLEDYDNMIYVLDYSKTKENALNGKINCVGEWYYYYGAGKYGIQPTLEEAEAAGAVMDSEYQPAIDHDATPIQPTPSQQETTVAPTTTVDDNNDTDATKPTVGGPSNDASSSTKDSANKNDNGTVQTGDASMAFIVLFSVVAAAGVAIFARKKIFG